MMTSEVSHRPAGTSAQSILSHTNYVIRFTLKHYYYYYYYTINAYKKIAPVDRSLQQMSCTSRQIAPVDWLYQQIDSTSRWVVLVDRLHQQIDCTSRLVVLVDRWHQQIDRTQDNYTLFLKQKVKMKTVKHDVHFQDPDDAYSKLQRLNLKKNSLQEKDIVHVILGISYKENPFNPYYASLLQKFCEYHRRFMVSRVEGN